MNELIMPHNVGVKNALENMKEVLALYKKVIGNYRPLLDGERYLTDREVAHILKVRRRFFNFGCKTTVSFGIHRYAKYSSLRNKNGLRFGNLTPSPFLPDLHIPALLPPLIKGL